MAEKNSSSETPKNVSPERLHQKVGESFGGYEKVQRPDGSFRMERDDDE